MNLGTHPYPQGVEEAFIQEVEDRGGTEQQAECWLKEIESQRAFHEAIGGEIIYIEHERLTSEGWKVYVRCLE